MNDHAKVGIEDGRAPVGGEPRVSPGLALTALLGSGAAAAALFVSIPAEESGRKVTATIQPDKTIVVQHVAGKQYLKAYRDMVGIPTACDGVTTGVKMGQTYTPAQCDAMLEREIIAHAAPLIKCVPGLYGREKQIVAGVGLAYHLGPAGVCQSTIAKLWNAGKWREGCERFPLFNKGTFPKPRPGLTCEKRKDGRGWLCVVPGFVQRRARERATCLTGVTESRASGTQ